MISEFLILGLSFLLGIAIGSFLNVIVLRLDRGESIGGRSYCPHCHKTLAWFELMPLFSFLIQAGKCRTCKHPLSWQYPVGEILSGIIFTLIAWRFIYASPVLLAPEGFFHWPGWWIWPVIFLWLIAGSMLLAVAMYDFKHYLIPDIFLIIGGAAALALALFQDILWRFKIGIGLPSTGIIYGGSYGLILGRTSGSIIYALIGAAVGAVWIGLVWFLSRGRGMGFGDVKLSLFLGLLLGWPDILVALFAAFMAGFVFSLPLLFFKKKGLRDRIPFGPFLIFGAFAAMLVGDKLMAFYFSIFPTLLYH